jgi:hypothetical protein
MIADAVGSRRCFWTMAARTGSLYGGASELTTRAATQAEHNEWEELRDAAIESDDDPDDFNAFLIPITDPDEDEDDDGIAV